MERADPRDRFPIYQFDLKPAYIPLLIADSLRLKNSAAQKLNSGRGCTSSLRMIHYLRTRRLFPGAGSVPPPRSEEHVLQRPPNFVRIGNCEDGPAFSHGRGRRAEPRFISIASPAQAPNGFIHSREIVCARY